MPAGPRHREIGARGVQVDVGRLGVRQALAPAAVRRIVEIVLRAERVPAATVSITFVSDTVMGRLNARHLGRRGSTDVIAFAMDGGDGSVVADVYVSPAAARRSARAERITVREEMTRLVVHGTLHAVGYDHPHGPDRERSAMWRRQEELVRRVRRGSGR